MNKILLSPVLCALLVATANAADTPAPTTSAADTTSSVSSTPAAPPAPAPAPATTTAASTTVEAAAPAAAPIDCNYHIPAKQTAIDTALITTWAEKATLQSFSFSPATIQNQLDALKPCYTDAGWKGFNDALQKSGNIDSIKAQQLNVSSQANGQASVNTVKDGQWKVTLPIQVVYQNDKEKVTQQLVVGVLVGRKTNGDLGIMQLVATTRTGETTPAAAAQPQTPAATPAPATPAPATPK